MATTITLREHAARQTCVLHLTAKAAAIPQAVTILSYASMRLRYPGNAPTKPAELAACIRLLREHPWMREPAFEFLLTVKNTAWPMLPEWAESLRDQCEAASAAFFFKQWGEWAPGACAGSLPSRTERTATWWDGRWLYDSLTPRQSEELHRDDAPDVYLLGKKAAGAMLDGREWKEFPTVRP